MSPPPYAQVNGGMGRRRNLVAYDVAKAGLKAGDAQRPI
jgi:hypothetical protein